MQHTIESCMVPPFVLFSFKTTKRRLRENFLSEVVSTIIASNEMNLCRITWNNLSETGRWCTWRSVICDLKIHWIVYYIESTALWKLCERIKKGQKLFSTFYVKVSDCAKIPQYNNLSNVHNFNPRVALTSNGTFENISTSLHAA